MTALFQTKSQTQNSSQDEIYQLFGVHTPQIPTQPLYGFPGYFTPSALKAYPFTTENFAAWLTKMPIRNKRIAGICGSGDFAINAFLMGAKEVLAIDIMHTACLFGELKLAAIKRFNYVEFLSFFATSGADIFNSDSYSYPLYVRIRDLLSVTAREFFDQLIKQGGNNPYLCPGGFLIWRISPQSMPAIIQMNPYLRNKHAYGLAQKRIKPVLFYPQEVSRFLNASEETYDMVYLSNTRVYNHSDKDILPSHSRYNLTTQTPLVSIHHLQSPLSKKRDLLLPYQADANKRQLSVDVKFVHCEYCPGLTEVIVTVKKQSWLKALLNRWLQYTTS